MTKRILPDALLAAYAKLGATPKRSRAFARESNNGHGLGAYAVAELGYDGGPGRYRDVMLAAGYSRDYISGYYDGFDEFTRFAHTYYSSGGPTNGDPGVEQPTADYKLGWDDGKAGWDAVKHLAREGAARG